VTERGKQLHATADRQIAELIALISAVDEVGLRRPCPGREKLGDGTVAAAARHTADNYQRIAAFVQTSDRASNVHEPRARQHGDQYTADNTDPGAVVEQLSSSRDTLARVADLTDSELDAIPPKDSFRFCDGQRTFEQVLASLLKHQSHQIDALKAGTPNSN
jgi:DinB superfamily